MSNENDYDRAAGKPLPDFKTGENLPDYQRNRGRVFAPKPLGADVVNIFGTRKTDASDSRIRNHKADQYRDFILRSTGKPATDEQVKAFLGE